jgi:shikimate kinase
VNPPHRTRYGAAHRRPKPANRLEMSSQQRGESELSADAKEMRSLLKKCPLYFVGCMGSGKSVVAKYVAMEIGYRFLDTDELIELVTKKTIPEIFRSDGEEALREVETAVLDEVHALTGVCVATGGGAVLRNSNWGHMHSGIVVWLSVPVDVLAKRLEDDVSRPLLHGSDTLEARKERLSEILNARAGKYAQADVTVFVSEEDGADDVGREVMRRVSNFVKENPPRFAKAPGAATVPESFRPPEITDA